MAVAVENLLSNIFYASGVLDFDTSFVVRGVLFCKYIIGLHLLRQSFLKVFVPKETESSSIPLYWADSDPAIVDERLTLNYLLSAQTLIDNEVVTRERMLLL